MIRLGLFGCGKLNTIVANCYTAGLLEGFEIVACYSASHASRQKLADSLGISACNSFDELLDRNIDYLVEATNPKATIEVLEKTLSRGINVVLLSIGALARDEYRAKVERLCRERNVRIHLASGAIAGFQVLRTAKLMGLTKAALTNTKGPAALAGSAIYTQDMATRNCVAFEGSAFKAIAELPTGINVGVATALASLGVHDTRIVIRTEPGFVGDSQCIDIEAGDEVRARLDVYSRTSDIAGYSVVALLQNLVSPICF